jgi:hypothetical protein
MAKTKGNFGGVVVRDDYVVFFQMRGYLCVGNLKNNMKTIQSSEMFPGMRQLKVICAGSMLRAYVDGKEVISLPIEDKAGRIGVYSHKGEVEYHDIRVDTKVSPAYFVSVAPVAKNDALVLAPNSKSSLDFKISNTSGGPQAVVLKMSVKDWQGKVLVAAQQKNVEIQKDEVVSFDLPALPKGFYCIEYSAVCGKETVSSADDLPLAVQERGKGTFKTPDIVLAGYSKYANSTEPVYLNTYVHGTARMLQELGFNAILADGSFTKQVVDIYGSYGIATICRLGAFLDSPTAIGTFSGDEPKLDEIAKLKEGYAELAKSGKKVGTCMIGESMGRGEEDDPMNLWQVLDPDLRIFRWYGIKKGYYGLLHGTTYKGWASLSTVLTLCEGSSPKEFWFIPPSFGVARPDAPDAARMKELGYQLSADGYYANPEPAEMKGLMYMAVAHGTKGIVSYTLQDERKWVGLIRQKSLLPSDGKFAAAADAAANINKTASLLKTLGYGGFDVRNSDWVRLEAVPRKSPDGKTFIFLVNKDRDTAVNATIAFPAAKEHSVKDLFSGKEYPTHPSVNGMQELAISLLPGDAALLSVQALLPVQQKAAPAVAAGSLDAKLMAAVKAKADAEGAALMTVKMPSVPCLSGDGIGFGDANDPRMTWQKKETNPRLFSWSGGLAPRTEQRYIALDSALLFAQSNREAYAGKAEDQNTVGEDKLPPEEARRLQQQREQASHLWTLFPALNETQITPEELRAMLHLSLANGSQAVLVPESAGAGLQAVVAEVVGATKEGRKVLPSLKIGGLDPACVNPHIALIPLVDEKEKKYIYVINLNLKESADAEVNLLTAKFNWTAATDVNADEKIPVSPSTKKEGYTSCNVNLRPGEGKLIALNVESAKK